MIFPHSPRCNVSLLWFRQSILKVFWLPPFSSIGLASATSQLDRNAWQRVAKYKSGCKTNLAPYLLCMEPHRESTEGSNTSPASTLLSSYSQVFLVFFLQVQIPCSRWPCYILSSCATSQVRRAVSFSVVPVQHWCLEEDPSRPTISFPLAVLFVVDSLLLILVGHSKGKTHETMKRRQVHHTLTSNDFHAALFVDKYLRPSIDVDLHDRKQPHTPHKSCRTPIICSIMNQWAVEKLRTLKPPCEGKTTLTSERPVSPHAFVWDAIFV